MRALTDPEIVRVTGGCGPGGLLSGTATPPAASTVQGQPGQDGGSAGASPSVLSGNSLQGGSAAPGLVAALAGLLLPL